MVDRSYGVRQSQFIEETSIPAGSSLGFFNNGYNYQITYANFLSGLGVTGSIAQDGDPAGVPVLDIQGTVNYIRNLEAGSGVSINVSAQNGIEIEHNFTVDSTGEPLMQDVGDPSPTFVSLVAGTGINIVTSGTTIQISNDLASIYGVVYMQGNATATVIASISIPVKVAGTWTTDILSSFTATTGGRLTYTGTETQVVRIDCALTLSPVSGANQHISAYIAKNGSVVTGSRQMSHISSGDDMNMSICWQSSLTTNDYIEVFVQNSTATNNITVSRVVLSAH